MHGLCCCGGKSGCGDRNIDSLDRLAKGLLIISMIETAFAIERVITIWVVIADS